MNSPFFSVFIPAKGRPRYLDEAIQSVLLQDFQDVELVISNNGADIELRKIVEKYLPDERVRYVEQTSVLNMPAHWEKATKEFVGEYLLILTDRSLLKAGSLAYLHKFILREKFPKLISWPWDLYYDHLKFLVPFEGTRSDAILLNSNSQLRDCAKGESRYPYSLPRGLNSCVKKDFIAKLRAEYGPVFRSINPDFSFGYLCLMNTSSFVYLTQPLFISQGIKVSNGGNSLSGDASTYFDSLGINEPLKYVPIKLPLVFNGIHEDFLSVAFLCGQVELIKEWDRKNYYLECLAELDEKKSAGILKAQTLRSLEMAIKRALENESTELQLALKKTRTIKNVLRVVVTGFIKKMLGSKFEVIRSFLLQKRKNGIRVRSALDAAGFSKKYK